MTKVWVHIEEQDEDGEYTEPTEPECLGECETIEEAEQLVSDLSAYAIIKGYNPF